MTQFNPTYLKMLPVNGERLSVADSGAEIRYRDPAIRVTDRIYGITDNG